MHVPFRRVNRLDAKRQLTGAPEGSSMPLRVMVGKSRVRRWLYRGLPTENLT